MNDYLPTADAVITEEVDDSLLEDPLDEMDPDEELIDVNYEEDGESFKALQQELFEHDIQLLEKATQNMGEDTDDLASKVCDQLGLPGNYWMSARHKGEFESFFADRRTDFMDIFHDTMQEASQWTDAQKADNAFMSKQVASMTRRWKKELGL